MYKMITIDIDDTLLNDDRVITEGTKQALLKAVRQGTVVTLATGRMFASAKNVAKQLELNVPIITYQGSYVKNLLDETVLYERYVPQSVAQDIFLETKQRGLHLQAYVNDTLYVREDNERIKKYSDLSKVPYIVDPEFDQLADQPNTKLLVYDTPEFLDELQVEWKARFKDQVHITKSKPYFLEITHPEGTKGHAVRHLAAHFGCTLEQVIAIGDAWNDKEMIEVAGLGVAMGNAIDSLKLLANHVTASNNDEGVKQVIEQFVLKANA